VARIEPLRGRHAPLLLKVLNVLSRRMMGNEMEPAAIMAHNPRLLLPYAMTTGLVNGKSHVDPAIRSLAMELAAHINQCNWCVDFGRAAAIKGGVAVEKLDALGEYAISPLFTPRERAALALAESITRDVHVSDATWDEARAHFSDRELLELVVAVAMETFYNRVNGALAVEAQGFCAMPMFAPVGGAA
jgi:AhpD family alkylhydroperoxidase